MARCFSRTAVEPQRTQAAVRGSKYGRREHSQDVTAAPQPDSTAEGKRKKLLDVVTVTDPEDEQYPCVQSSFCSSLKVTFFSLCASGAFEASLYYVSSLKYSLW